MSVTTTLHPRARFDWLNCDSIDDATVARTSHDHLYIRETFDRFGWTYSVSESSTG